MSVAPSEQVCFLHHFDTCDKRDHTTDIDPFLFGKKFDISISQMYQGLKLRKYFRGQVGPHQINFGSPHNLLGAHQVRIARLTPRLQGALRGSSEGPRKPWD